MLVPGSMPKIIFSALLLVWTTFYLLVLSHNGYFSVISPSMTKRTILFLALDLTVMVLENRPGISPVPLYVTSMVPLSPAFTGSLVKDGTVQPHEAKAWLIISGAVPTFVKLKLYLRIGSDAGNVPKLQRSVSNLISA